MRATFKSLVIPDASAVLRRFPVAIFGAAMLARQAVWTDFSQPAGAFACIVALMAAIALGIWTEARGMRRGVLFQGLALALGAAAWFSYGSGYVSPLWTVVALGVAILAAAAPGRDEQELWSFDARAVALLIFALVAISVVVLGLIAIRSAAEYLFELRFAPAWTKRVFEIGYFFVFPVYWCALLPRPEQERLAQDDLLLKAAVVLGALLAVVVAALAVLLHAYAARILLDGAIPKNQVGWIVSVALLVGLLAWFLSAAEGGPAAKLRRLFRSAWFPLTFAPALLLAVAIRERIGVYGVTSDRYAVVVAGAVSFVLLALVVFNRGRPPGIRSVLVAGLLVATLAAVGPQSMPNVVATSQIARLKSLLESEKLLVDGRVAAPIPEQRWQPLRRSEISSIIREIDSTGAVSRLAEVAPSEKIATAIDAYAAFGVDPTVLGRRVTGFAMQPTSAAIENGRLVSGVAIYCDINAQAARTQTLGDVRFELGARELVVRWPDGETAFDVLPLGAFTPPEKEKDRPSSIASTDGRSLFLIQSVNFRKIDAKDEACGLSGAALLRPR